jgi:hypothetical protein
MLAPPVGLPFPILADQDAEPHTCGSVSAVALDVIAVHAFPQAFLSLSSSREASEHCPYRQCEEHGPNLHGCPLQLVVAE